MSATRTLLWTIALNVSFIQKGNCLRCLSCHDITHPRNCDVVASCEKDEVCFASSYEAHDGFKTYSVGCTHKNNSHICGGTGASFQCSECCRGDLCNSQLCGELGYPSKRGPICYSCSSRLTTEPCNVIDFCNEGEVCDISEQHRFTDKIYTSGCMRQHECERHIHGVLVGKRNLEDSFQEDDLLPGNCQMCCDKDLCNNACSTDIDECTSSPCMNNGTCVDMAVGYKCACLAGYTGNNCEIRPARDCLDVQQLGLGNTSGVYTIVTPVSKTRLPVLCDMTTDGGGWTVFQNRFNGSVDFYRNFSEYEYGFGAISGEFWLGLKYIYELSACAEVDLRMDLQKSTGETFYEVFGNFSLSSAPDYTLHINPGTGTAGDSQGLSYNKGQPFSTYDYRNNNGCAVSAHGGWWYDYCALANLNGIYTHPPGSDANSTAGMIYFDVDVRDTLKASQLMIRRKGAPHC